MNLEEIKIKSKNIFVRITDDVKHFQKKIRVNSAWYGNEYGGFYAYLNNINEDSVVYSFGVGEDLSFDLAIYRERNCSIYCFDPTPKSIDWVKKQSLPEKMSFFEYGLSDKDETATFFLPKNKNHVSGSIVEHQNIDIDDGVSVQLKNLKSIMKELGHQHIDLLKMDIEGAEYKVVDYIVASDISISQILIEFHDRFFEERRNKSKKAVKSLMEKGYKIYAISDSLEEVSFIKEDAI